MSRVNRNQKPVNLALQGGGVHGAFTWGVLDRLLEDDRLAPDAISATSAGAMNAVVMAWGVSEGGREGARAKLAEFWRAVSPRGEVWGAPWPRAATLDGRLPWPSRSRRATCVPGGDAYAVALSAQSPRSQSIAATCSGERRRFRAAESMPVATRLFISATNVRTGKIRVFENHDLFGRAVLASACLPTSSRRWRSTAKPTGTAASWAIRPSSR